MNLEHIQIRAKSLDASIHSSEDMLPRQPNAIHHDPIVNTHPGQLFLIRQSIQITWVWNPTVAFRQDDDSLARDVVFLQSLGDNTLGLAKGIDIGLAVVNL